MDINATLFGQMVFVYILAASALAFIYAREFFFD